MEAVCLFKNIGEKLWSARSNSPEECTVHQRRSLKSQVREEFFCRSHLLLRHSVTSAPLTHASVSIHMGTHTLQTIIFVHKHTFLCFDNWCTNKIITIIWNVSEMPKSIRFFLTLANWNVMNKSFEMKWQLSNSKSIYVKQSSEQTLRHIKILPVHVATTYELHSSDIFTFYIPPNVSSKKLNPCNFCLVPRFLTSRNLLT